jgi:nitrite reductase
MEITQPPAKSPQPRPHRRTTQIKRNAVVVAWIFTALVLLAGKYAQLWPNLDAWAPLHAALLGALGSAITIWSAHFADTLLHRPAWGGALMLNGRLGLHSVGAALVITGVCINSQIIIGVGASCVAVSATLGVVAMVVQKRRAVAARMAALVDYYICSLSYLMVGALAGWSIKYFDFKGQAAWSNRMYLAHVPIMVLGVLGITVLGTLVVLWPTMLRTKMEPTAPRQAQRALPGLALAVAVIAFSGLWRPLAGIGALLYLLSAVAVVAPLWRTGARKGVTNYAGLSTAAALAWLAWCVIRLGVGVSYAANDDAARAVAHGLRLAVVSGFALQILLAALSFLTPVMLGGGPAMSRLTHAIMDRYAWWRITTINLCLALACLPLPPAVRGVTGLSAALAGAYFFVAAGQAIRARRKGDTSAAPPSTVTLTKTASKPASSKAAASVAQSASRSAAPTASAQSAEATGAAQTPDRRGALAGLVTAAVAVVAGASASSTQTPGGLMGLGTGLGSGQGSASAGGSGQVVNANITISGMSFVPSSVDVPVGATLRLTLKNTGTEVHDLVLATGQTTGRLAVGESKTITVNNVREPIAGWCSVAGHRAMGMVFDVKVAGVSSNTSQAGHQHSASSQSAQVDLNWQPPSYFKAHDARAPRPQAPGTVHRHTLRVSEITAQVGAGVTQKRMTYNGGVPGPVLRGQVGDHFEITLVNDGTMSHSIDFHAGVLAPDKPMRSISPGQSLQYNFTATRSGIWLYHCSTAPMSVHLAAGMHGVVIIDPPGLSQVDHEFVLIQSEIYLGPEGGSTDEAKVAAKTPDLMAFNGMAFQYKYRPLQVSAGQRVRFWLMDAGPSLPCTFHVVGGQFDQVFYEGAWTLGGPDQIGARWSGGSQALNLGPCQGGFVEFVPPQAGHYTFVTHAFADMEKGAVGVLQVQ